MLTYDISLVIERVQLSTWRLRTEFSPGLLVETNCKLALSFPFTPLPAVTGSGWSTNFGNNSNSTYL